MTPKGDGPVNMKATLQRAVRWLHPGLRVKRWLALLTVALAGISFGVMLLFNLSIFDLMVSIGGPRRAVAVGVVAVVVGVLVAAFSLRQLVRSVTSALHPEAKERLVDLMLAERRLEGGPRVVAIGGGTGLSTLLRGLKLHTTNLTAVATVADDGGSSGRLRADMGMPPPGDLRNCLVALADEEPLMTELFDFRFNGQSAGLGGHSFGNLLIAALTEITGDFEQAIREASRVLAIRGRVLPATADAVELCGRFEDGSVVHGETSITNAGKKIDYVYLAPANPRMTDEVREALESADLIVVGPGSTFTSVIPNLLVPGFTETVRRSSAAKVFVCNVMTQPGETTGFSVADHVRAIQRHTGEAPFDYVLMNTATISEEVLAAYHGEGADAVEPDYAEVARMGLIPVRADLISVSSDGWVRHNPTAVARELMELLEDRFPALV